MVLARLLLSAALAASGDSASAPGDWWKEVPPEGGVGDSNPSAPDKIEFWDKLQEKAFDEFCKLIEVPVSQRFQFGPNAGTSIGYHRRLRRLPTGNFAVLDQAKLGLSLGLAHELAQLSDIPLLMSISARLEGESFILRPLEGRKSCEEVDRLLNPLDVKTTLPFTGERISAMALGELWRVPLTLTIGAAVGAGVEVAPSLPISISLGGSGQGRTSVSLYRMAEDKVRFRLRLDQALIYDAGGGVTASIATYQFGLPQAENILLKLLTKEAARQLNRYLALALHGGSSSRQGVNTVLEFVLDPRDPAQMEKLAKAAAGDLGVVDQLWRIAQEAKDQLTDRAAAKDDLVAARDRHEARLDSDSTFAGMDEYDRDRKSWSFRLPLLFRLGGSNGKEEDRITILDDVGGRFNVYRADKRNERAFLDIPFLGQIYKNHRERSAQVFTYQDASGRVQEPLAVYVEQQGFLRAGEGSATALAERADELMRLAGTRGEGRDDRGRLPIDRIVPPVPQAERSSSAFPSSARPEPDSYYFPRGVSSLTLAFNQKAVADILASSVELVLKAYSNALSGLARSMMEWALAHGKVEGGELDYDSFRLTDAMGMDWHNDRGDANSARAEMSGHARTAMAVTRDLAKAAAKASADERAQAFRDLLAGKGESGLAYDEILRVVIQLVDPLDLSGEFFTFMSREGGGRKDEDVKIRLSLHGRPQDPLLEAAARARNRFAEPSYLID